MHFDNDIDLYRVIGTNIKQYREQAIIMVAHSLHFVPLMYVVAKCLNADISCIFGTSISQNIALFTSFSILLVAN